MTLVGVVTSGARPVASGEPSRCSSDLRLVALQTLGEVTAHQLADADHAAPCGFVHASVGLVVDEHREPLGQPGRHVGDGTCATSTCSPPWEVAHDQPLMYSGGRAY